MDYKEEYQKALERAKKGLPIDEVFPELKESEDERIRKELLKEIEFIIPHECETDSEGLILPSYHARIDRYKSYLEKQKEHKPADLSELMVHKEPYIAPVPTPIVADEQKPAEWSEEDEVMCEAILNTLERVGDYGTIGMQKDWLKLLKDRRNSPKSNTNSPSWKPSEEQIDALEWMLTTVSMKDEGKGVVLKNLIDDLKKQM